MRVKHIVEEYGSWRQSFEEKINDALCEIEIENIVIDIHYRSNIDGTRSTKHSALIVYKPRTCSPGD